MPGPIDEARKVRLCASPILLCPLCFAETNVVAIKLLQVKFGTKKLGNVSFLQGKNDLLLVLAQGASPHK